MVQYLKTNTSSNVVMDGPQQKEITLCSTHVSENQGVAGEYYYHQALQLRDGKITVDTEMQIVGASFNVVSPKLQK